MNNARNKRGVPSRVNTKSPRKTVLEMDHEEYQAHLDLKEFNKILRETLWAVSGGKCWYCGCELGRYKSGELRVAFSVEHKIPRCRGGAHSKENTVAACFACNSRKGTKTVEEYRMWLLESSGASFTQKQLDFWAARGLELPLLPLGELPVFFGEKGKIC